MSGGTAGVGGTTSGGSGGVAGSGGSPPDAGVDASADAALDATVDAPTDASVPVPLGITGCILWLDPSFGVTTDVNKVKSWKNRGTAGAALDVSQTVTTKQPQLDATGSPAGGPVLSFARSDATGLTSLAYAIPQPSTVLAVARRSGSDAGNGFHSVTDGLDLNTRRLYFSPTGPNMYAGQGFVLAGVTTNWHVYTAIFDGASSSLQVDNAAAKAGSVGSATSTGISIGDCPDNSLPACTQDLDGDVADVLVYNRALTAGEVSNVVNFLRTKNAI